MLVTDEEAAAQAITALAENTAHQQDSKAKVDVIIHSGDEDTFVDVHELFALYDALYFRGLLLPRVALSWSSRLTLCAGICELLKDERTKRYTRIRLKLSEPLLKYRPRSDLLNTLLHESIHAYFFITSSLKHIREDATGGHGEAFHLLAAAINDHGGYEITQFHSFHDEVDSYRTHIWRCEGPCRTSAPWFGYVRRAMNRAPGKTDTWWERHEEECGGVYVKVAEPKRTRKQLESMSSIKRAGLQKNKLDGWFRTDNKGTGDKSTTSEGTLLIPSTATTNDQNRKRARNDSDEVAESKPSPFVVCPICDVVLRESTINRHIDNEHPS